MFKKLYILLFFIIVMISFKATASNETKIKIIANNIEVEAILNDSKASKDLISRLPLEFTMNDLYGREKYINLSKSLVEENNKQSKYEVGDIGFWYPWRSLVIFYKQDGESIPQGIFILGKIKNGVEEFDNYGMAVKIRIELK